MTGWREFWRRLRRRGGLKPGRAARGDQRPAHPASPLHPRPPDGTGGLFRIAPQPQEALPGEPPARPAQAVPLPRQPLRQETLLELVEAMGVRPADPWEGEVHLRAWLELTSRQKQVVCLVCAGHTNQDIAKRLRISPNTVKGHLTLALGRFGVRSRAELRVALAGWDFSRWKAD